MVSLEALVSDTGADSCLGVPTGCPQPLSAGSLPTLSPEDPLHPEGHPSECSLPIWRVLPHSAPCPYRGSSLRVLPDHPEGPPSWCSLPIRMVLLSPSSAPLNLSKELLWEQNSGSPPQGLALPGLGHLVTGVPGLQPSQLCGLGRAVSLSGQVGNGDDSNMVSPLGLF